MKTNSIRERYFRTIVVATDFSEGGLWAVERAAQLPLAPNATLSLLAVAPKDLPAPERDAAQRSLSNLVEETSRRLNERHDIQITSELLTGEPYTDIIRHARSLSADLIVLGRHGRRVLRDMLIGSTARRVISKASTPILVVGSKPLGPYQRPLLALELEDTSQATVDLALRAVPKDVNLLAMHAVHIPFEGFVSPTFASQEHSSYRHELQSAAQARLDRFIGSQGEPGVQWSTVLRSGDTRIAIMDEAITYKADLIVVGTHSRSGIAHMLVGSVAEWVIQNAPCDVLVARPARFSFELP